MKTLVVGQKVSMTSSGVYGNWGEVAEITPESVVVRDMHGTLLRFDKDGKELDDSRRKRLDFGPDPNSDFHTVLWFSAPEFQPWEIDETYFPKPEGKS